MTDIADIVDEIIKDTELSRIPSDLKSIIIDNFLFFENAWFRLQTELEYLTTHHPVLRTKDLEKLIKKYSSMPSLESLYFLDGLLEKINCMTVKNEIKRIGIQSTELDLSGLYLSRLPISLFKMEVYFDFWKNLTKLSCGFNKLTFLDLRTLTALEYIDCSHNELTDLFLSPLTPLDLLDCSHNELTILDLSAFTTLAALDCSHNELTMLNLKKLAGLLILYCQNNKLAELHLHYLTSLRQLNCENNLLTLLNLNGLAHIMNLKSDYTWINHLNYYVIPILAATFSDTASKAQELITSIFPQAANSFLPSFSANNNNQNQGNITYNEKYEEHNDIEENSNDESELNNLMKNMKLN